MRSAFAVLAFGAALSVAVPLRKRQDFDFGGGSDSFDASDLGFSSPSFGFGSDDTSALTETAPDVVAFNDPASIDISMGISAIDDLLADDTQIPTEFPAEAPADTETGETLTLATSENVTPPTAENVTPPIPENVTPPTPENVTPPTVKNISPPTPGNGASAPAENQTPTPEENTIATPPPTGDGAIALAPNGITSQTLNPPTGDTTTTAGDDAEFFDAIDDILAENSTTSPTGDTTTKPTAADDSSVLTDEDLDDLDALLNEDNPTPVTSNDAANNVFPDAKVSAGSDDLFSSEQISDLVNFVSDFAFTPGKTFDINELASIFPDTQPTSLPASNSAGGSGSSGGRSSNGRGTSGNTGKRPAAGYNANNDILQKGVALAFNQLAKLLNPAPAAQNSPAAQPIRIVTVRPVPVTRQLISTSRLLAAPVVTPVPVISGSVSRSGTASVAPSVSLLVSVSASALASASAPNTTSTSEPVVSSSASRSGSTIISASASLSSPIQVSLTSAPPASSTGGK